MLPRSLTYPEGEPALVGRYTETMKCARCGVRNHYTHADYSRLPVLTVEDFDALAKHYGAQQIADKPSRDFEGYGLPREHGRDMYRGGFRHVAELEEMERGE